jgi:hypothetical protein
MTTQPGGWQQHRETLRARLAADNHQRGWYRVRCLRQSAIVRADSATQALDRALKDGPVEVLDVEFLWCEVPDIMDSTHPAIQRGGNHKFIVRIRASQMARSASRVAFLVSLRLRVSSSFAMGSCCVDSLACIAGVSSFTTCSSDLLESTCISGDCSPLSDGRVCGVTTVGGTGGAGASSRTASLVVNRVTRKVGN